MPYFLDFRYKVALPILRCSAALDILPPVAIRASRMAAISRSFQVEGAWGEGGSDCAGDPKAGPVAPGGWEGIDGGRDAPESPKSMACWGIGIFFYKMLLHLAPQNHFELEDGEGGVHAAPHPAPNCGAAPLQKRGASL